MLFIIGLYVKLVQINKTQVVSNTNSIHKKTLYQNQYWQRFFLYFGSIIYPTSKSTILTPPTGSNSSCVFLYDYNHDIASGLINHKKSLVNNKQLTRLFLLNPFLTKSQ